jgi:hypothetical protein
VIRRVLLGLLASASSIFADEPQPFLRTFAGAFIGGEEHNYFVESALRVPVLPLQPVSVWWDYRESTPFLHDRDGPQAEVLNRQLNGEVDYRVNDQWRLVAVGGYRASYQVDAAGKRSAIALGGGLGSTAQANGARWNWMVTGGALVDRHATPATWWTDARLAWRMWDFVKSDYRESPYTASLSWVGDLQAIGTSESIEPFFRFGPAIQLLTAQGNRAQFQLQWYHNDNNEFMGQDENGFLFGLDVSAELDPARARQATVRRDGGWFPFIWGMYDLGFSSSRRTSRFEMNVEMLDFDLGPQLFTVVVGYESRQEYRTGDYDNIGYSVALGLQTPVGLASPVSQGQPLTAGVDFLHRSDHALNPAAARVPATGFINNGSHNLLPRLRLQTAGWNLPYRNPDRFDRQTDWLHLVDWRLSLGWNSADDRNRGDFAGQLGVNWDLATLEGIVLYMTGQISAGSETPDWMVECGARRPRRRIFARYDDYGMRSEIARGKTLAFGVGVNL